MSSLRSLDQSKGLQILQEGLRSLETLDTPLDKAGLDQSTLHDLQRAIEQQNLSGFVNANNGKRELITLLVIMKDARKMALELVESAG